MGRILCGFHSVIFPCKLGWSSPFNYDAFTFASHNGRHSICAWYLIITCTEAEYKPSSRQAISGVGVFLIARSIKAYRGNSTCWNAESPILNNVCSPFPYGLKVKCIAFCLNKPLYLQSSGTRSCGNGSNELICVNNPQYNLGRSRDVLKHFKRWHSSKAGHRLDANMLYMRKGSIGERTPSGFRPTYHARRVQ